MIEQQGIESRRKRHFFVSFPSTAFTVGPMKQQSIRLTAFDESARKIRQTTLGVLNVVFAAKGHLYVLYSRKLPFASRFVAGSENF